MSNPQELESLDEAAPDTGNVPLVEYDTRGQTVVATKRPYRFASKDKDIPQIHSGGVKVNATQAKALIAESGGLVFVVTDNQEGDTDAR